MAKPSSFGSLFYLPFHAFVVVVFFCFVLFLYLTMLHFVLTWFMRLLYYVIEIALKRKNANNMAWRYIRAYWLFFFHFLFLFFVMVGFLFSWHRFAAAAVARVGKITNRVFFLLHSNLDLSVSITFFQHNKNILNEIFCLYSLVNGNAMTNLNEAPYPAIKVV